MIVGTAHSVVLLMPLGELDKGRFGALFVTNYKLSFVPLDSSPNDVSLNKKKLENEHTDIRTLI